MKRAVVGVLFAYHRIEGITMKWIVFAIGILILGGCTTTAQRVAEFNVLNGPGISLGMSSQEVKASGYVCVMKATSTAGDVDQCATQAAWDKYGLDDYGNADPTLGGYSVTVGLDNDGKVVYVQ